MTNAILITGNTYPHRRTMRAAGALFDRDEKGYIAAHDNQAARDAAGAAGLDVVEYDATDEQLTPATGERLRQIRQEKRDRYAERLRDRADAADRRANEAHNKISQGERDFLALAEPIKIGHHSERRHRKLIERYGNAMDKACTEAREAEKLRSKADWIDAAPARVKGDAQRRRDAEIEIARDVFSKGDYVDTLYGPAIIEKINQKTARVRVEKSGSCFSEPLNWLKLIEKREPVFEAPAFKKGDKVYVQSHHKQRPGVILRKTPRGYSVRYFWTTNVLGYSERIEKATFVESSIQPREEHCEQIDS